MDESDKTPPKRKAGRPRIEEPRTLRGVRMTDQEWEMFQAMGGAAWLRKVLASLGPGLAPLAPLKGVGMDVVAVVGQGNGGKVQK